MSQHLKPPRRGQLRLVIIAAAASGLSACGDDRNEIPQSVSRAQYDTFEACVEDWGSDQDCEPQLAASDTAASAAPAQNTSHAGGHGIYHWWGPYYSRAGTVYRYDGREDTLLRQPARAGRIITQDMTPAQIYASTGRYASTPVHTQAGKAKSQASGRGGFGGTGRGVSGGG